MDTEISKRIPAGSVVRSVAGRDRYRVFLVVGVEEAGGMLRLLTVDGRLHRVDSPKRKNPRHVRVIGSLTEEIAHVGEFDDGAVRRLIERYDHGERQ